MDEALSTIYTAHVTINKLRHDVALAAGQFDHAVIFSGALHYQFLDDMSYPFKVNPHFKAWVPVTDNPNCFVIYTPGVKPKVAYWTPIDYWHVTAKAPTDRWVEKFDVVLIANPDDAKQFMPSGRIAFIGEWDERFASWGDMTANPEVVMNSLHWDRSKKTEYEIECLRQANQRGARGHVEAERAFREGLSEFEIHFRYLRAANHVEEEVPYGNIIACNEHASTLHYYHHDRTEFDKTHLHSFLIDAGAQVNGYASDITRTYSRKKDGFHDLIAAMDAMQLSLVDRCKPNVNYIDLHLLAHHKIAEILLQFGFIRDVSAEAAVESGLSSTFFPHGLGHFLGLQVHDVAGFHADREGHTIPKPDGHPYLRLTRVVDTGMFFTIEPGLYFIETLLGDLQNSPNAKFVDWAKVDSFRQYGGIRIEDDILITENGHENFTRVAFAELG